MNQKSFAMLAHLTPLGWLIALMVNSIRKDSMISFYLRQLTGLYLCFFITGFIPEYYIIAWGFFFVLWIYSFVGSIKGMKNIIPIIGSYFQHWFRKIG